MGWQQPLSECGQTGDWADTFRASTHIVPARQLKLPPVVQYGTAPVRCGITGNGRKGVSLFDYGKYCAAAHLQHTTLRCTATRLGALRGMTWDDM